MKINSINQFNIKTYVESQQNKKLNFTCCDTVSFSGKKKRTLNDFINKVPYEAMPERIAWGVRKKLANGEGENEFNIYEYHNEVYSGLRNAKSLEEAKIMYPEFESIITPQEFAANHKKVQGMIREAVIEGKEPKGGLSLHVLKCAYDVADDNNHEARVVYRLGKDLCIPLLTPEYISAVRYANPTRLQKISDKAVARWGNQEFRDKIDGIFNSEEYKAKMSQRSAERWQDAEYKERMSAKLSERWTKPEYRAVMADRMHSEHFVELQRAKALRQWESPEFQELRREYMTEKWQDPEWHAQMVEKLNSPEIKQAQSEAAVARWERPEYREKMEAYFASEESQTMRSEQMKKRWEMPEYRDKMVRATTMAWDSLEEVKVYNKQLRDLYPHIRHILSKDMKGIPLTEDEKNLLSAYYRLTWAHDGASVKFAEALRAAHGIIKKEEENSDD